MNTEPNQMRFSSKNKVQPIKSEMCTVNDFLF